MASQTYIFKNVATGRLFRIARRTIDVPGCDPIRDWVKIPCGPDGYWEYDKPVFVVYSPDRSRIAVERMIIEERDGSGPINTVFKVIDL